MSNTADHRRLLLVFGAFDRHNVGDMLFAHVTQQLIAQSRPGLRTVIAGLAARDLRAWGGHDVVALSSLAPHVDAALLHAGGELLTCTAWEAAVMLEHADAAQACIARYGRCAEDRAAFARASLGTDALAPYVAAQGPWPSGFNAVGGVSLASCDANLRAEVLVKLRHARTVSVRDAHTQAALQAEGIDARLAPDPVALVAELFHDRIEEHEGHRSAYLAVQFSADFGDDATLARIASQLDASNIDIVLFRAGAAPWHDDLSVYARLSKRMKRARISIFESLDIWDICALIAGSAGYAGSSLHGRIVAMAHGLPRVSLLHPDEPARTTKQTAYASTWDRGRAPVRVESLADAIRDALHVNRDDLKHQAAAHAHAARREFDKIIDDLVPR
jgi:hypothetical protein